MSRYLGVGRMHKIISDNKINLFVKKTFDILHPYSLVANYIMFIRSLLIIFIMLKLMIKRTYICESFTGLY